MTNTSDGKVLPQDVIAFWQDVGQENWYKKNPDVDARIRERFTSLHGAASAGELGEWEQSAQGALALLILLDQFSRNMFRDDPRAFACDAQALAIAKRAIDKGFHKQVADAMAQFFRTPFMHAEDIMEQARGIALAHEAGSQTSVEWAVLHADIIRRFGRFPHRNKVLNRKTSEAEQAFLDGDGFSG